MLSVLVQARRKSHGDGKIQTHNADCRLRIAPGNQNRAQKLRGDAETVKKVQRLETEAMRRFRVEREEKRPEGAIEHAVILPRRWRETGSGTDFVLLQAAPAAVDETLDRLKVRLVGHLPAVLDPISQVQIRQGSAAALLDLPQDVVGAEARAGVIGVVKSVDR